MTNDNQQPEALSIAKRLKDQQQPLSLALRHKAAAELRRLHEVNAELVEAFGGGVERAAF